MKTSRLILSFTFFLLFLQFVSAVEVSMDSSFSSGETLLAKISGNFIDQIRSENVVFYRGHVKIPMLHDVVKIDDDFYVYAILVGKNEGNYSMNIEGIRYMKGINIVSDDVVSNFTITNETATFSINPGILITNENFFVEFQNSQDRKITINIKENSLFIYPFIGSEGPIELKSGEKKRVFFNVAGINERTVETIEFSAENFSYILPVYLDPNKNSAVKNFEFQPHVVEVQMSTESESKRILYIKNTGGEPLENILLDVSTLLDSYVSVSPKEIDKLNPRDIEKIEIQIISDQEEKIIEGEITAYTENLSTSLTLVLDFVKDFIPADGEEDLVIVTACGELRGTICAENKECSGESIFAKDGVCCIALFGCKDIKKSSTEKWIGWGILSLALVIFYWLYKGRIQKSYKRLSKSKRIQTKKHN